MEGLYTIRVAVDAGSVEPAKPKTLASAFSGSLGGTQSTGHIVLDTLGRIMLDQRNMLVGSDVVDGVWMPSRHDLAHAVAAQAWPKMGTAKLD